MPELERFLQTDPQTVQWRLDAPYTLDVADQQAALAHAVTRADLEQAVNLYRGDLLPNCYDDWILAERDQLRQVYIDTLERLTVALEQARDNAAAIRYAQRLLQHDPLRAIRAAANGEATLARPSRGA